MDVRFDSLESMCELIVDCPHSTPRWTDEGVIVLRNQNIRNGVLDLTEPSYTNEEDYQKRIKRAAPQAGDIVFTREAPMGEVCLIPEGLKCCLGQRQVLLRPKKGISGEYLFWALQSPHVQHQISWNEGTGTTVSNVRIPVLKALQIPRHHGDEDEIAKHLTALANRIELYRQINQTLDQMAQALFKSWFVDFDPVFDNALTAGNEIPEALQHKARLRKKAQRQPNFTFISDDIRALFPSEFEETDEPSIGISGWIPKGWQVTRLEKCCSFVNGKSYKSSELQPSKNALVTLKSFQRGGGYRLDGLKEFTGRYKDSQIVNAGDIVLSCTDVTQAAELVGRPALVATDLRYEKLIISLDVMKIVPNQDEYKMFLYCLLSSKNFLEFALSHCTGTTVLHLSKKAVPNYQFSKPNDELVKKFCSSILDLNLKKDTNIQSVRTLVGLRDTLLPKLISTELTMNKDVG